MSKCLIFACRILLICPHSERGNKETQLADVLSPVSKKKTGRAYVALARAHSEKCVNEYVEWCDFFTKYSHTVIYRGDLQVALDLYRKAETYVPNNIKLKERWILFVIHVFLLNLSTLWEHIWRSSFLLLLSTRAWIHGYRIIEIEWAVKNDTEYVPTPKPQRKQKSKKSVKAMESENPPADNTTEMAEGRARRGKNKKLDGAADFGLEVTNTETPHKSKRSIEQADVCTTPTPQKRRKRSAIVPPASNSEDESEPPALLKKNRLNAVPWTRIVSQSKLSNVEMLWCSVIFVLFLFLSCISSISTHCFIITVIFVVHHIPSNFILGYRTQKDAVCSWWENLLREAATDKLSAWYPVQTWEHLPASIPRLPL